MVTDPGSMLMIVVLTHGLLPLGLLAWLVFLPPVSRLDWGIKGSIAGLLIAFFFYAGYWTAFVYFLRYAWVILFLIAMAVSFKPVRSLPFLPSSGIFGWIMRALGGVLIALTGTYVLGMWQSQFYDQEPVALSFPLQHGLYAVSFGGNGKASSLMNYHYSYELNQDTGLGNAMAYAVDIVKLNGMGFAAGQLFDTRNESYAIFHEAVLSPCDGEVVIVEDQWPNQAPYSRDRPYSIGNRIVIKTNDLYVLMGHLQQGSITVKVGDQVTAGMRLAQVGNSGWSDRPHLHIQVSRESVWSGQGVPVFFEGRNPVKNALFIQN